MSNQTVETRVALFYWDDRGFAKGVFKPKITIELEDAVDINKARLEVAPYRRHPCLFDMREVLGVSRETRAYGAHEETAEITTAFAFLAGAVTKVLGNFYLKLNKPAFPARMFDNEEKAVEWLLSMKEK